MRPLCLEDPNEEWTAEEVTLTMNSKLYDLRRHQKGEEQRNEHIPPLVRGSTAAAWMLTQGADGSHKIEEMSGSRGRAVGTVR